MRVYWRTARPPAAMESVRMRARRVWWTLGAIGVAVAAAASSVAAQTGPALVHCYDEARDLVALTRPGDCAGRIVDADEAAAIRVRRAERYQRALQAPQEVAPGRRMQRTGTGFYVAADGHMVTSQHVVEDCAVVSTFDPRGDRKAATVVVADRERDLALVASGRRPQAVVVFRAPLALVVGQPVALVGYPIQGYAPLQPVLTRGFLFRDNLGKDAPVPRFQVQVDVRGGNSGGPVLDLAGLAIGIIHAKVNTPEVYRQFRIIVDDIGLAIRNDAIFEFLDRAGVPYRRAPVDMTLNDTQLLERARSFIARIECWK